MGAIIAFITAVLPTLVEAGTKALPLILQAREAVNQLGTMVSKSDPEFMALDSAVAAIEKKFQDDAAKRLAQDG